MKSKVREVQVKDGQEIKTALVYGGWYCIKGGKMAFHTSRNMIRKNTQLNNIYGDDVFTMGDDTRFTTAEIFKDVVDGHIEYIIGAQGSLEDYFKLNS